MFSKQISFFILIGFLSISVGCDNKISEKKEIPEWPELTKEHKPWTRWWWHGNAVNKRNLVKLLEEYKHTGLGGLEITPIYGVRGYEDEYIEYLSPEWMELFECTLKKAEQLNLGIDMATGTGWPFGGPWIDEEIDTPKNIVYKKYELTGGRAIG